MFTRFQPRIIHNSPNNINYNYEQQNTKYNSSQQNIIQNQIQPNIMHPQNIIYPSNIIIPPNFMHPSNIIHPENIMHQQNIMHPQNIIYPLNMMYNHIPQSIIRSENITDEQDIIVKKNSMKKRKRSKPKSKSEKNNKKSEETNIILQNSISKDDYVNLSKINNSITIKYSKCMNNSCSNPNLYPLRKNMFYTNTKSNVFCRDCFQLGMKGLHGTICCEDPTNQNKKCFLKAIYGFPGNKPLRCSGHKEKNMINVNKGDCQFINSCGERCKEKASYGFKYFLKRERCFEHKLEDMIKIELRSNKKKKVIK